MTSTQEFIDSYLQWLKDNTTGTKISDSVFEITSPFLDRHNDYMQIYISEEETGYVLSDDGFTIADLELSGMSFGSTKRNTELNTLLKRFGVEKTNGGVLTVKCQKSDFPSKKHSLLQAMLAANDLFVMSQANITSLFLEDVQQFLKDKNIRFSRDIGIIGRSAFNNSYEFLFSASPDQPERFMKLANNLTRSIVESIIFTWNDTLPVRDPDSKLFTLINDLEKAPPQNCLDALGEYSIKPIMWSNQNQLLECVA